MCEIFSQFRQERKEVDGSRERLQVWSEFKLVTVGSIRNHIQRRLLTQMLAAPWQDELGPANLAILHVYDITGHEVAGTRTFGGLWIEDE